MNYRRLGRWGLQVSELALGSWITYHNRLDEAGVREFMAVAYDAGINFFDTAEAYAGGRSEELMGAALRALKWPRLHYVVSTKFWWGLDREGAAPNRRETLNRKYLLHAIDGSLARLGLEHVDLVYCHRPDPHTPLEETVWAMNDIITRGKALYWGTSEWPAARIRQAWEIAERHHLHKPVVEQPEYHLFHRTRVEHEYAPLYEEIGLGLTTWSPLAGGLLTGKYRSGIPDDSRAAMKGMAAYQQAFIHPERNAAVGRLEGLAAELGCSVTQLAIAWATKNRRVSSVILGASGLGQLQHNLGALDVQARLTKEVLARIDEIALPLAD